jgi:hypothetical protein
MSVSGGTAWGNARRRGGHRDRRHHAAREITRPSTGPKYVSVMATPSSERVPLTWEEVRRLYPGTADVVYLDPAAVGVISTRVRDAMTAVLAEHEQLGIGTGPRRAGAIMLGTSVAPSRVWWVAEPTRSRSPRTPARGWRW